MYRDLRYGARMLLKHKGFTAAAILTLALGIGTISAVFSLIQGVLTLAVPDPNRMKRQIWNVVGRLQDGATRETARRSLIAARRAARVNPLEALRHE